MTWHTGKGRIVRRVTCSRYKWTWIMNYGLYKKTYNWIPCWDGINCLTGKLLAMIFFLCKDQNKHGGLYQTRKFHYSKSIIKVSRIMGKILYTDKPTINKDIYTMSKYCRNNLSTKIDEYTSFLLFTCGSVHAFKKISLNWGIIYIWPHQHNFLFVRYSVKKGTSRRAFK